MAIVQKITPCLWFDNQAEDAAKFYVSIFKNSGIETVTRYGKEGFEKHGKRADRHLPTERPNFHRAEWRPELHVVSCYFVRRALRVAG